MPKGRVFSMKHDNNQVENFLIAFIIEQFKSGGKCKKNRKATSITFTQRPYAGFVNCPILSFREKKSHCGIACHTLFPYLSL